MRTFTIILTAAAAFALTAALGSFFVPFLRKVKYGQTILDIGPSWHKNKQGTPTMGGVMFVIGIFVAVTVGYITYCFYSRDTVMEVQTIQTVRFFAGLLMSLAFGFLGFLDDYIKVVKKQNQGLTARQKLVFQILIGAAYLVMLRLGGDTSTVLIVPFLGQLDLGMLYYPLALFIIVGAVNAVNLTDGIDGLASSVTFVAAVAFMILSAMLRQGEMQILSAALAGAMIGFLVWNFHPAKVFMGDTGSLFLGGMVVALAFGIGLPVLLVLVGFVYFAEALSVILQVASFKLTGKRIFKMSPIHHHFEMCGWSEVKIVTVFSVVTAVGCIIAVVGVRGLL
ncbi:MAG: phospho-N-acetylmuramoyl-pentapeptide-transferase [Oscillospiraceae bacterium]|nr:phospho-N-acetylmuramoyl-pentapeptide-transferase [Oscillospiraceae bacterium]MDY4191024.1 phospho-N-acetylmuramoyl-pentapeptide-transferase [Oscillospiraceae bacterium]